MEIPKKQQSLLRTFIYQRLKDIEFSGRHYLILIGLVLLLNKLFPGDMCNPGLGVLVIMVAPIITIVLILRNIYLLSKGHKEYIYSLILHFILIITWFIIFIMS